MVIYVDDILIAGANKEEIDKTATELEEKFELTRLGELTNYLGINVQRDSEGVYYIDQEKYIERIIDKFGLQDSKTSRVPTIKYRISENSS